MMIVLLINKRSPVKADDLYDKSSYEGQTLVEIYAALFMTKPHTYSGYIALMNVPILIIMNINDVCTNAKNLHVLCIGSLWLLLL